MTDIGWEYLYKRLEGVLVAAPDNYTAENLTAWLAGYTACTKATRRVLDEFRNDINGR